MVLLVRVLQIKEHPRLFETQKTEDTNDAIVQTDLQACL